MSEFLHQFHFLRPLWLLALLPVLLLAIALWYRQQKNGGWQELIAPHLLPYLLERAEEKKKKWPIFGLAGLWVLATLAIAGPSWQKVPQPVEQNMSALVIVWDLSPSMLAQDIKPSREARSRMKLIDLLQERRDGQTALIAYSAEAYTVTPLTDDFRNVINLLSALSPTIMPSFGSNPEMAFDQAQKLLQEAGAATGDILFVTDEVDPTAFDYLRSRARDSRFQLTFWGVGTAEGAPIPLPEGGFAKDTSGNTIIAKLNKNQLSQFSANIGAYYVPMVTSHSDVETLNQLLNPDSQSSKETDQQLDRWRDHGQYLAILLLPFIVLLFRRGWIFTIFLLMPFVSLQSPPAAASTWQSLWQTQDQLAQKAFEQGYADAASKFTTPDRRGAAYYEQGRYAQAAQEFSQGTDAINQYNLGTAHTRAGDYESALVAFDQALALNPDLTAAHENRAIAQQLLEQAQEQADEQQPGNEQEPGGEQEQGEDQNSKGEGEQTQNQEQDQTPGDAADGESGDPGEDTQEGQQQETGDQETDHADEGEDGNPITDAIDEQQEQDALDGTTEQQAQPVPQETNVRPTEEEQMLEQMLRRVPDDPGGLLRNKFEYERMQRQRSMHHQGPFSNNQAKKRW